jgi:hypothetical protein
MRPTLDPTGHWVPRMKPTYLLHTWRPHRRRPFALVLHLHQHQSSRNVHLQLLAKNQSTQHCQSLITQGSDHPPVLEQARDEQHSWVNSPKSNSQSPDSLHGSAQDFGDGRNTSWALHSQVMIHKNSLNQGESKNFRQEHH